MAVRRGQPAQPFRRIHIWNLRLTDEPKKEAERLGDRPACGLDVGCGREGPNVGANEVMTLPPTLAHDRPMNRTPLG
jgi:hypothetical protein